jgi:putative DNA primase/helicase
MLALQDTSAPEPAGLRFPLWWIENGECACPDGPACASPGKHPLTRNGVKNATDDQEQLKRWSEEFPQANWGLATGALAGVIVVDLDRKPGKDGVTSLRELAAPHGGLPRTRVVRSGSGGLHLYFRHPGGHVPNSVGKLGPGIDVRGEGGYVVAEGSGHVSGGRYVLAHDAEPAHLPAWLLAALKWSPLPNSSPAERQTFDPATPEVLARARRALAEHGPAIEGQGGDLHTFVACALLINDFALTPAEAWPLLAEWNETCRPPWNEYELGDKLRGGSRYAKRPYGCERISGDQPIPPPGARVLYGGGRAKALEDADEALGSNEHVFQRNGALTIVAKVRDAKTREDSLVRRDPESLVLQQMTPDHVLNVLAQNSWVRLDRRSGEWVSTDFPPQYARGVVAATGWRHIRPLTGLIGAPTLDANMGVIDVPGYHADSGLLLTTATKFRPVPLAPTKDDAVAALKVLREPFGEFPWVRRESDPRHATAAESVHLAAILTAGIRHLLDTAPAVAYDAPRRGSGKSLLGDAVGTIWHGTPPAHANFARADDEFRKMIAACLVAGDRVIMIDNVDRPLRSPELCNALTTTRYSDRRLGHTERYVLDARVLWIVNGNNLALTGDISRRVIISTIDPQEERPENRSFRVPHLLRHVERHRDELAPAALTVLKAFALVNPPSQAKPLGSFERWSRMVREALIWVGMPDPCETTDDANEAEPETQALAAVLRTWRAAYTSEPKTAPQIVNRTELFARHELRDALVAALGGDQEVDARGLGNFLRRWKGVVTQGMRLRAAGKGHAGYVQWQVQARAPDGSWV